jgi:anthranilate phosphoribosyltransferase
MAQALSRLGAERAWIVHSDDGLDEIATSAPTRIAEVNDGDVSIRTFDPVEVGVERITLDQIRARDLEAAAALVRAIFDGVDEADVHAARDIAVVNAAAALVVTDGAASMKDGMEFARQAIASGAAARTLEALARVSHESA